MGKDGFVFFLIHISWPNMLNILEATQEIRK